MALFQPTNITPDMKGGVANGVVYVPANPGTDTIAVSWTVNGNSPLVAYKIDFYKNDANSTYVTTTGKVTLGTPFSAISADGTETQFSVNVLYSLFNTTANASTPKEGKIQITQWWGSTDDESVTQKSMSVFRLTAHSNLSISGPVDNNGEYVFTGTFTPPNSAYGNVTLNWTRWYCVSRWHGVGADIVSDTGKIWGATAYTWSISNLDPDGYDYTVFFEAETSDGEQLSVQRLPYFSVLDGIAIVDAPITVVCDKAHQAVKILAQSEGEIKGTFSGTYSTDGSGHLHLGANGAASWSVPAAETVSQGAAPWSFLWRGKLSRQTGRIFTITQADGTQVYIEWDDNGQVFDANPASSSLNSFQFDETHEYIISFSFGTTALTKNKFYWYMTDIANGAVAYFSGYLITGAYTQEKCTSVTLNGPDLETTYWKLCYGENNADIADAWTNATDPVFLGFNVSYPSGMTGADAYQYAEARYFGDSISDATAYLYADNYVSGSLRYLGSPLYYDELLPGSYPVPVYDYTAVNGKDATYAIVVRYPGENGENAVYLASGVNVNPCFWAWALIEADETDTDKLYEANAVYLFSANVSTSEMANGNTRNLYSTFTRYPVVMRNAQNRKSGTLGGLIGSIVNGEYTDTNATMDAIYALSTSQKPLFLRNRRGEFMRISLAGEIKMSVEDNTVKQQVTASIPWVEIADTTGISVIDTGNSLA